MDGGKNEETRWMTTAQQTLLDESPTSTTTPSRKQTPKPPRKPRGASGTYTADDIKLLAGLEAVRTRPAMYIGGSGSSGLMHLIWEIIDNGVDEAVAGFCDRVDVTLQANGCIEIYDNGRGIPVDKHPAKGVSALEVVFTELHSGGKFGQGVYTASGGLHGVGAAVVNAMSTKLEAEVLRNGKLHKLCFLDREPGQFSGKSFKKGHALAIKPSKQTGAGTRVKFWPDMEVFDDSAVIDSNDIKERLKLTSYLVPDLKLTFCDKRTTSTDTERYTFMSKGGIADLVSESVEGLKTATAIIHINGDETFTERVPIDGKITEVERLCKVDIAMQWVDGFDVRMTSFVNTIPTPSGGTHMAGFEKTLTRAINNLLIKDHRRLKKFAKAGQDKATGDDVQEGLVAAVKVSFDEPQFRGQTKQVLGTPSVEGIVSRIVYDQLRTWIEPGGGTRTHVKALGDKISNAIVNRIESRSLLETKRKMRKIGSSGLPDKLADCRSHGLGSELILVEGDSAAGPAKRGRDSEYMAVLPLRGKIVNAGKATVRQVLDNQEAKSIFTAMGAGAGKAFNIEDARYGRIVILCDADVDGSHIRCLLLTLIYRYMKDMLLEGRVFSALPPLYTTKVSNETYRAYSEDERDKITTRLCKGNRKPENIKWQRFKGLGEMNVEELRHCALDPDTRTLKRMTLSDGKQAEVAAQIFETLMGSNVALRRDYLMEHSHLIDKSILDI